ncbi:hypothetical protein LUZ60_009645 [Juncus effusus]|nr:hypothetical protein LUZ60_009645 [Juncus effusus]
MDHNTNQSITSHEHIIDISNTNHDNINTNPNQNHTASSSNSNHNPNPNPNSNYNYNFAPQSESSLSSSSSSDSEPSTSQNAPPHHNQQNRRRNSPLNSGLWISVELIANLSQIIAAIVVLSVSKNEHPKHPLFEWIVGYTLGCFFTLPHLYWRFVHRNRQNSSEQSNNNNNHNNTAGNNNDNGDNNSYTVVSASNGSRRNPIMTTNPRVHALVDHFKMALDCFFAVWFVVGNVWIFGGHSSFSNSPNLYRLCIAFLTLSCIGYAMPFILCLTICCCLPCIISFLGYPPDLLQNRGADQGSIDALPVRKFRLKRGSSGNEGEGDGDGGGILAAGTETERVVSADDAVCCICLAKYIDNEELRELPCTHFFHQECVDKWLKINALCPLCKAEVPNSSGQGARSLSFGRRGADRRVRNDMQIHI